MQPWHTRKEQFGLIQPSSYLDLKGFSLSLEITLQNIQQVSDFLVRAMLQCFHLSPTHITHTGHETGLWKGKSNSLKSQGSLSFLLLTRAWVLPVVPCPPRPPHLPEISSLAVLHGQQGQVIGSQVLHSLRHISGSHHIGVVQPRKREEKPLYQGGTLDMAQTHFPLPCLKNLSVQQRFGTTRNSGVQTGK